MLLNPPGPVQFQLSVPVLVDVAVRFNLAPLQIGLLFEATGVAGGFGSVRLKGPTALEEQPLSVTVMFEYEPAGKLLMITFPLALAVMVTFTMPEGPVY